MASPGVHQSDSGPGTSSRVSLLQRGTLGCVTEPPRDVGHATSRANCGEKAALAARARPGSGLARYLQIVWVRREPVVASRVLVFAVACVGSGGRVVQLGRGKPAGAKVNRPEKDGSSIVNTTRQISIKRADALSRAAPHTG